ncbi:MAG: chemotaxis protein CheW [Bacillota bacterium]
MMAIQKNVDTKRFLVFKIDNEEYGIDIHSITTIIEKDMDIARVPKLPAFIKGIINLRGEIIPVISLRIRFGLSPDVFNQDTRIIIVKFNDISVGLIVDSVSEVVELGDEAIESMTNIAGGLSKDFVTGVGKANGRMVTLLNVEKLVLFTEND